jgi:FtsH-binding integral membrane protein
MLSIYNYMASGVLLTGVVAVLFSMGSPSLAENIFLQPGFMKWIVMLAPVGLVMWLSFGINKLSEGSAKAIFWVYAALMGASLSTIFLAYTGASIASTFFATAAGFGALSIYGYTTKRDLSGFGKFLLMGLVGLIIASIINVFTKSSTADLIISIIGVFLFAGLTVYDTQKIKNMYWQVQGTEFMGKAVVMGALTLYLDFINLFLFLLRFMGDRR